MPVNDCDSAAAYIATVTSADRPALGGNRSGYGGGNECHCTVPRVVDVPRAAAADATAAAAVVVDSKDGDGATASAAQAAVTLPASAAEPPGQ